MIISIIFFFVIMLLLPCLAGGVITSKFHNEKDHMALTYVAGIILMFATFYLLVIPATILGLSLSVVTIIWCVMMLFMVILNLGFHARRILNELVKEFQKKRSIFFWIFLFLLILQLIFTVISYHYDADDATYVGMAVASYFDNSINAINPTTGEAIHYADYHEYSLAPFPIFWAMLGQILRLHPAIIMHTLCPVILLVFVYLAYSLLGGELFADDREKELFLLCVLCLTSFGNYSFRSSSTFMYMRIWQGKALLAAAFIPLTIYLMMRIKKANSSIWDVVLLVLNSASLCLLSGMGTILAFPLLGIWGITDVLSNRRWKVFFWHMIAMVPCMVIALLYILL